MGKPRFLVWFENKKNYWPVDNQQVIEGLMTYRHRLKSPPNHKRHQQSIETLAEIVKTYICSPAKKKKSFKSREKKVGQ